MRVAQWWAAPRWSSLSLRPLRGGGRGEAGKRPQGAPFVTRTPGSVPQVGRDLERARGGRAWRVHFFSLLFDFICEVLHASTHLTVGNRRV